MRRPRRAAAALSLALTATLGLAACGGDDEESSSSSSSSASGAEGSPSPAAAIDTLTGVDTAVQIEQSFADAITGLGLTAGTVGSATITGDEIAFPITGGNVTYFSPDSGVEPYVQGSIEHQGSGLSLSAGGTTVELTDFVVDPGASVLSGQVTVNGEVAAPSANLFFLDGRTLQPLQVNEADGSAVLTGTQVRVHPDAAALLNQTFMTDAVPDFLTVGTATITVALPAS